MKFSDLIFDYLGSNKLESGVDLDVLKRQLNDGFALDFYEIKTITESKDYKKPIGKYYLLSTPMPIELEDSDIEYCVDVFFDVLHQLIGNIKSDDRVLVVGLGNRHISSDSLGAKVVGKINITIHNKLLPKVMAIAPSVMGLTGIETYDIITGVISRVKPTHIILIDSLCASAESRLCRSMQLTNTGLCPGGGIGNKRKCIDRNIAPNVYSIGVPLLIYAKTFVSNMLENYELQYENIVNMYNESKTKKVDEKLLSILRNIKAIWEDKNNEMIVSLKDIEECVEILSNIIAKAINKLLGVEQY